MEDQRHKRILEALRVVAGSVVPVVGVVLGLPHLVTHVSSAVIPPDLLVDVPFLPVSAVGVVVLLLCAAGFYAENDRAQAYRALAAAIFTGMASVAFASDPGLNLQNVIIGLAVVISIAAIVVPPIHRVGMTSDQPKATHRSA